MSVFHITFRTSNLNQLNLLRKHWVSKTKLSTRRYKIPQVNSTSF